MNPWDNLALNVPTVVSAPGERLTVATRTSDPAVGGQGFLDYPDPIPPSAKQEAMTATIGRAISQLQNMQNLIGTFVVQPDYSVANLANLNDLLHKAQQIATGLGIVTTDLIFAVRFLAHQYEGA